MKDKLKKKKKDRFDYYGFLMAKGRWSEFCDWCNFYLGSYDYRNDRKARHNFIKKIGLWPELLRSKYDARFAQVIENANAPWVRDENDNLIRRKV